MKKKQLFAAALVTLLAAGFTACSSDEGVADSKQSQAELTGEATMSLAIHLPSTSGSRADNTDGMGTGSTWTPGYDDGKTYEYNVNNVWVYLYGSDKKFIQKAQGTINSTTDDSSDNVTKKVTVDLTITGKTPKYACVVVNNNDDTPISETSDSEFSMNSTFAKLSADNDILDVTGKDKNSFMMTNSTWYTNETINDLVAIGDDNIVTKSSGKTPTALDVYVERVAAKVEVKENPSVEKSTLNAKSDYIKVVSWGLNVLNKKYYPVKSLVIGTAEPTTFPAWVKGNATWPNGTSDSGNGDRIWNTRPSDYRCFWAVDPNYNTIETTGLKTEEFTYPEIKTMTNKVDGVQYCLENTFDNEHQCQNQTTTAIVLAKFVPAAQNTSSESAASWVVYNNANYSENEFLKKIGAESDYYVISGSTYQSIDYTNMTVDKTTEANVVKDAAGNVIGMKKVEFKINSGVEVYKKSDGSYTKVEANSTAEAEMNKLVTTDNTKFYPNGYCYYPMRIRHFYEGEVPLVENDININGLSQLGRYGVVRNHWYELTINSITGAGKPITDDIVTPPDNTPDDEVEKSMQFSIKVLSWAKRGFSYNL